MGDRNTKWFHMKANKRRKVNKVKGLFEENGQWVENEKDMEQVVNLCFQ